MKDQLPMQHPRFTISAGFFPFFFQKRFEATINCRLFGVFPSEFSRLNNYGPFFS